MLPIRKESKNMRGCRIATMIAPRTLLVVGSGGGDLPGDPKITEELKLALSLVKPLAEEKTWLLYNPSYYSGEIPAPVAQELKDPINKTLYGVLESSDR